MVGAGDGLVDDDLACGAAFVCARGGAEIAAVAGEAEKGGRKGRCGLGRAGRKWYRERIDGIRRSILGSESRLIHTARRAARDGRRLFVVATNRAVLRPLEVTGSAQLFTVLPDQEGIPGA